MLEFMFATGIECSYPTIHGGTWRMDQLEATRHYDFWERDLKLVRKMGLKYLRYGPPLYKIYRGPDCYDWDFTDEVCALMEELGIVPIMDLCHFGVPAWLENFQNPDLPQALAEYAGKFAERYPWVQFYTPVNEMYVTTRNSALHGLWNEQLATDKAFVTAVRNVAKASVLMIEAIRRERRDAIFVTSESSEFYQACCPDPDVRKTADFENQRRFIALDLLYAHPVRDDVYDYLIQNGLSAQEYQWFMNQDVTGRAILGVDYYDWNEKLIDSHRNIEVLGELFGWYVVTQQYYDRYRRPVMHTETNSPNAAEAPAWMWRQWHNVELIRQNGVPVVGFTWYSLQDQVDWDTGLKEAWGSVYPVGLFDLNRDPRIVAHAYKHLIEMYKDVISVDDVELAPPFVARLNGASVR